MSRYNLWFILLLPFTFCSYDKDNPEPVVKTIRKDEDLTPICNNSTQDPVRYVFCRIRPVKSREEECHLIYHLKRGFEQGCDSRFSLMLINQTMFLHLNNLTPENSGNYSCQCSARSGTFILQLNITVEDDEDTIPPSETTFPSALITLLVVVVLIVVVLLGIISACCCRNKRHRRKQLKLLTWNELNSTALYKEAAVAEPYLKQEMMRLYSKVKVTCRQTIHF